MTRTPSLKTALLAAASLAAAGVATAPAASAAPFGPAPYEVVAPAAQDVAAAHSDDGVVNRWIAGGALASALAGLIHLIGWPRIAAALRRAGSTAAATTAAAARYAASVVRSPFRFVAVMGGLSLFALVGVGFYDVEWIAGLATGVAIAVVAAIGVRRIGQFPGRR